MRSFLATRRRTFAERRQGVGDVCLQAVESIVQELCFAHTFPARPAEVAAMRRALSSWLETVELSPQERQDAALAASEAAANAAEHAYDFDGSGLVHVEARASDRDLLVTIRDEGGWREARPDSDRGLGRTLIEALMRDVTIDTGTHGTVVRMHLPMRANAV